MSKIPSPTIKDLEGVIKHHLPANADLRDLPAAARACRGRSPADISMLCRDARRAARQCKRPVCADDVLVLANAGREVSPYDWISCVHEAGHALAALHWSPSLAHVDVDRLETSHTSRGIMNRQQYLQHIGVCLAGRVAEHIILDAVTTGASDDLAQATAYASAYHVRFGFGAQGLLATPDHVSAVCAAAARELLDDCNRMTTDLLVRNHRRLLRLAHKLRVERYLDGEEVRRNVEAGFLLDHAVADPLDGPAPCDDERGRVGNRWGKAA